MTDDDAIRDILTKIVHRAARPKKAGSTEIMVQEVPAALIEQAKELLGIPK